MTRSTLALFASAALATSLIASPVQAAITVCNQGASCISDTTNVNLDAFTDAPSVTGTVGTDGPLVTFTSTQGNLSTNPGAATVFVASGEDLTNLTFTILSGFTAAEFNLEHGSPSSFLVNLTNSAGETFSQTLSSLNGSNIFNIVATEGSFFTSATFSSTGGGFDDLKQLRVVALSGAVPEPATWAMMLLGFGGVGIAMRRRKARAGSFVQAA